MDEWYTHKERETIKEASPFTKEYLDIEEQTINHPDSSKPKNLLFYLKYLEFLQNNFMPYIFLWGGFAFRLLDAKDKYGYQITHITQGSIEKHFGTINVITVIKLCIQRSMQTRLSIM
jgi:hypothetical protein